MDLAAFMDSVSSSKAKEWFTKRFAKFTFQRVLTNSQHTQPLATIAQVNKFCDDHSITPKKFAKLLKKIGFKDNDVCALADGQIDISKGFLTKNDTNRETNDKKQDTCYIVNPGKNEAEHKK